MMVMVIIIMMITGINKSLICLLCYPDGGVEQFRTNSPPSVGVCFFPNRRVAEGVTAKSECISETIRKRC